MDGKPHLIRKKETLEYMNSLEETPAYLKEFKL
jgi:hypothetical protein